MLFRPVHECGPIHLVVTLILLFLLLREISIHRFCLAIDCNVRSVGSRQSPNHQPRSDRGRPSHQHPRSKWHPPTPDRRGTLRTQTKPDTKLKITALTSHAPTSPRMTILQAELKHWVNHLRPTNSLEHDPNAGAGENIFKGSGSTPSFADACRDWLGEQSKYHGEAAGQGNFADWGHYTRIVWPSTTSVGIASATSASGATYMVGRICRRATLTGRVLGKGRTLRLESVFVLAIPGSY
jgi:hypothetical protein